MTSETSRETREYGIAVVIGIAIAFASIIVAIAPASVIEREILSLLWAWAIGAGTVLRVLPWAKRAVKV